MSGDQINRKLASPPLFDEELISKFTGLFALQY